MYIKLTDTEGKTIYINADKILFIALYNTRGHTDASIVYMGAETYVKVSESPDMIVKLIERGENGKS